MNPLLKAALIPIALPARTRFTAGNEMGRALKVAEEIRAWGAAPILNYLGEHFQDPDKVAEQLRAYLELVPRLQPEDRIAVKPSQLGLDIPGYGMMRVRENIAELLVAAQKNNVLLELDMEDAIRAETSVGLALAFNGPFRMPTRVAVAARMKDSENFLSILAHMKVPVRLVKGAYDDNPRRAFSEKKQIEAQYTYLANLLLQNGTDPAFATHDETIINYICAKAGQFGLQNKHFEFQFLKGFRPRMQRSLVKQGYRVAVYIPFGPLWFEYGMRRWKFFRRNPKNLFGALFK